MSDNINRQAALDIFDDFEVGIENGMNEYEFKRKELLDLPSADRTGHWIEDEYGIAHCSECNAVNVTVYRNFCPECGADMRGDNNVEMDL